MHKSGDGLPQSCRCREDVSQHLGVPNHLADRGRGSGRDNRGRGIGWGEGPLGDRQTSGCRWQWAVWGREDTGSRSIPKGWQPHLRARVGAGENSANQRRGADGTAVRPRAPKVYAEFSLGTSRPTSSLQLRGARPDWDGAGERASERARPPRASTLTSTLSGRDSSHSGRGVFCCAASPPRSRPLLSSMPPLAPGDGR